MTQKLFRINLVVFLIFWLGVAGYTLAALVNLSLPYSLRLFGIFLGMLLILGVPLVWQWNKKIKSWNIQHQVAVLTAAVILIFYWGPFAPVHSMLSLHLDALQLRWMAFAYIWEVVLIGAMVVYAVLYTTRFADRFMKGGVSRDIPTTEIHARIADIPVRAWTAFVGTVLFGYAVGSLQLYYFALLPVAEVVKNLTNGMLAGAVSAFVVFFALERILRPALQKSGAALQFGQAAHRRRLSLFTKVYATSGLLALLAVGFFATMSYGQAQSILEEQVADNVQKELETIKMRWQAGDHSLSDEEQSARFGEHSAFLYIIPETSSRLLSANIFSPTTRTKIEHFKESGADSTVFIDRARDVNIIGLASLGEGYLASVSTLKDFDESLQQLLIYIAYIIVLIFLIVTILGTLLARSIILPMREIQQGRTVYTNDELEDLSHALTAASIELKKSYADLEKQVAERTSEIMQANQQQKEQIKLLDATSKRLVRRDFELQRLNDKLREIDQSKSQFVSIAAHQLRTPLSAIKWICSMFLTNDYGAITPAQKTAIERAAESTDRLIGLVGDLLNVARIEGGQLEYRFKACNIEQIVQKILNEANSQALEKNISISLSKPRRKLAEARADAEKLELVLQNIIENALLYTPAGGKIKVKILEKDTRYYQISITDTGIGIPKSQLPFIFQKFFRGQNIVHSHIGGTGLGLYMAEKIVEAHGGTIEVESTEGKGSTFTITLPYLV